MFGWNLIFLLLCILIFIFKCFMLKLNSLKRSRWIDQSQSATPLKWKTNPNGSDELW